jgi:hypothetical protein
VCGSGGGCGGGFEHIGYYYDVGGVKAVKERGYEDKLRLLYVDAEIDREAI